MIAILLALVSIGVIVWGVASMVWTNRCMKVDQHALDVMDRHKGDRSPAALVAVDAANAEARSVHARRPRWL